MTRRFKIWLAVALVVVFAAGLATGLFAGARHARHVFKGRHGGFAGERMREHIRRELQLTPDQYARVAPILDETGEELEAIRTETSRRISETMTQSHEKLAPLLTPEQRDRLERMRKRHRRILRMRGMPPHRHPHV
ncbi:MAG: hypothetical protein LC642_06000, partial [Verrucomicrobiaceae bacterium]|nr:hypothetical protein [Verrucomicrobiaceae bacterium]